MLTESVRVYGCTATLTEKTEKAVLRGFRNRDEYDALSIIRTSIDRPDYVELSPNQPAVFCPPRLQDRACSGIGNMLSFEFGRVATLAQTCSGGQYELTPDRIPKTIIFIDGAKLIEHVARILMGWLIKLGYSSRLARETVRTVRALTSKFDQDVSGALPWGDPWVWQQFGRAARGQGRHGTAVMFLPYWMFDRVGFGSASISTNAENQKKARQPKNIMATCRMQLTIQMSRAIADEDIADTSLNDDDESGGGDAALAGGRRGHGGRKQQGTDQAASRGQGVT